MEIKKKLFNKLNTSQIIALGFAGVIFVGGLLLWMPFSAAPGMKTKFIDAMFTATTATCVTGLVTVTTATHWSLFGKMVILLLIQLGGLGIITVVTMVLLAMKRKISLKNRKMIQESYNLEHFGGMVTIIRRVIRITFVIECLGAVAYAFCFVPEMGWRKGMLNAFFTSISGFCNAGIDILDSNSLIPYRTVPSVNLITMALIIAGGLGFTVWTELIGGVKTIVKERHTPRYVWRTFSLHSKLAITVTLILLFGGTVLFFAFEYSNPATMGNLTLGQKLLASAFQSVTTRTAGFLTIDQSSFTDASTVVTIILMLIGGSPMGTAGGLKTTTLAIMIITVGAYLKGSEETEVFHRKVPVKNIQAAVCVVGLGLLVFLTGTIILSINTHVPLMDIVYEVSSAIGTVGLTRGLTPSLNLLSKVVIIACMYLGRIGPITLVTALTLQGRNANDSIHMAEERVLIG